MRFFILPLIIFLSFFGEVVAQKKEYVTQKVTREVAIDGILNDSVWQQANWNGDFQMYYPYDNREPSLQTRFAVVYDKDFVYVAIKAIDNEPDKVVKRLTRRDNLDGDWLGVYFDSYNDLQTAYCFIVSAAGTKRDFFMASDGDNKDDSWDPIWWVETAITDDGWVAEMKIPFSQFRFVNNYDQTWGIQLERNIFRLQERSFWNPKKRDDPGWVHHFGKLVGLTDIQPKKVFDLYPYALGSVSTYEEEEGNPLADGTDWNQNVGLDGKVGLTNNLTLDFTINPDFGQVEADPSTVNLSGFELFFEEKRPFFIEGGSIIDFPLMFGDGDLGSENLFYSRRIGRQPHYYPDLSDGEYAKVPDFTKIIGAAKITGRSQNGLSLGVMETVTANENAIIKNSEGEQWGETVEPLTNYFSTRIQKDFGEGNTLLGGMFNATNRSIKSEQLNFLPTMAYSGGLDFTKYFRDKTWFFEAKAAFSYIAGDSTSIIETQQALTHNYQRPDADHLILDSTRTNLSGYSGNVHFGKGGGGRLRFVAATYFKSPGFEINDMGFVRHVDDIVTILWGGYRINEPFSIFKEVNLNMNHWSSFDFGGTYLGMGGNFNGNTTFSNNYSMGFGLNYDSEELSTTHLRGGPSYLLPGQFSQWIWGETDETKKVSFELFYSHGKGFDHNLARNSVGLELTLKPADNIEVGLNSGYNVSTNQQQYMEEVDHSGTPEYILGTIDQEVVELSLRLNWNLSPNLSLEYWGQPFFATGAYTEFKKVTNNVNEDYNSRFSLFSDSQLTYNTDDEVYEVDEDTDGVMDYSFANPDFNSKVFLHNMVFRWEYRPGSVLFFVWSQNREDYTGDPYQTFSKDVQNMFNFKPYNTFLVKISYRIGV